MSRTKMKHGTLPKELRRLYKLALEQGWRERSRPRSNHLMLYPPDKSKPPVCMPSTPNKGKRSIENTEADFRRSGLELDDR